MKGSFIVLLLAVAGTGAWQYVNVPKSRPNNCGCLSDTFCKVVFVNPKTVNKAESQFGRIKVDEQRTILNVVFDDLGSELGAGISGSVIEKDGRPYTVEPCEKNTDSERQFHRLIRQHLMVKLDEKLGGEEQRGCCQDAEICQKVDLNLDLFDQTSPESVYLETSIDPENYFDVKTADLFKFKQKQKLGQKTSEKLYYTNEGNLLTLTSDGKDRSALMTMRDGTELFSLKKCGENYYWRQTASPEATYGPGARSKDGNTRERPEQEDDIPPSVQSLFLNEDSTSPVLENDPIDIEIRAEQGADTCYYGDQYYCQLSQDDYVGGEGIVLDENNTTDTIGQDWCNTKCNETAQCNHFTWTKFRSVPMCYLMTRCVEDRKDPCLKDKPQVCMSGPKNCEPLENNANCTKLIDHGPGYVDWQCRDYLGNTVAAYDVAAIPWGTVCIQSCDSWRALGSNFSYPIEAHLKSTCTVSGNWTDTVAYDGQGVLLFPPATDNSAKNPSSRYPVPDDPQSVSLMCECDALQLKWPTKSDVLNNPTGHSYDPNTEKMTDFLCDYEMDPATMTVVSNNTCTLFCDNYLTAVVRCWDGGWTGKPSLGFWCQNEPGKDRGPTIDENDVLLVVGGYDGDNYLNSSEVYGSPSCSVPDLPSGRDSVKAVYFDSQVLACGGDSNDGADYTMCYTLGATGWSEHSNMTSERYYGSPVVVGDSLYMLGGKEDDERNSSVVLAAGSNVWGPGPDIPGATYRSCAVALADGFVIIGSDHSDYSTQVLQYDGSSWGNWANLTTGREQHSCLLFGGSIIVAGGYADGDDTATTVKIDTVTKISSPGPDMAMRRKLFIFANVNGLLLAVGGHRGGGPGADYLQTGEIFDPVNGGTLYQNMTIGRSYLIKGAVVPTSFLAEIIGCT